MDRTDIESYIEEIRTGLIDAGKRLEEAGMIEDQALADITELMHNGIRLIPRSEMAQLAGIPRNRTYQLVPKSEGE